MQAEESTYEKLRERIRQEVEALRSEFRGTFGAETVSQYAEGIAKRFEGASVRDFVPLFVGRVTREQLRSASVFAARPDRPSVLFVCGRNAGRSQMAAAFARQIAGERVIVRSAGIVPASSVHQEAIQAMSEVGIDISSQIPTELTEDMVNDANVIVTLGCGDPCPVSPGRKYVDWPLENPEGLDAASVRTIRDEIRTRVEALLSDLLVPEQYAAAPAS